MSILSRLFHGEIHDKPNAVHNTGEAKRPQTVQPTMPKDEAAPAPSESVKPDASAKSQEHIGPISPKGDTPPAVDTAGKSAQERFEALRKKQIHPAMFYSSEKGVPSKDGVWQDAHTVDALVEEREETPRG